MLSGIIKHLHFSCQTFNPQFVNKIEFQRPVHIGDLIRLRSRISYLSSSTPRKAICDITYYIVKPEKVSTSLSNRFSFIFELGDDERLKACNRAPRVTGDPVLFCCLRRHYKKVLYFLPILYILSHILWENGRPEVKVAFEHGRTDIDWKILWT